ncbi:MAG: glycosyltransferase, partial [Muribaculaceae bacterium]|nr:glycosyltransferase [Muribaculaceae bacterium]
LREAAAMGTPAILLEGSTASEVIRDRENGFLTERKPEQMAALIRQLSSDRQLLERVAAGAKNTLVRSWQDVVEEVSDRYESLIRRHNP